MLQFSNFKLQTLDQFSNFQGDQIPNTADLGLGRLLELRSYK